MDVPESVFSPETLDKQRQMSDIPVRVASPRTRFQSGNRRLSRVSASACRAEGRGFESLQPLRKRPPFASLSRGGSRLVRCVAGHPMGTRRPTGAGSVSRQAPLQALLATRTADLLHPGGERSKVQLTGRCQWAAARESVDERGSRHPASPRRRGASPKHVVAQVAAHSVRHVDRSRVEAAHLSDVRPPGPQPGGSLEPG